MKVNLLWYFFCYAVLVFAVVQLFTVLFHMSSLSSPRSTTLSSLKSRDMSYFHLNEMFRYHCSLSYSAVSSRLSYNPTSFHPKVCYLWKKKLKTLTNNRIYDFTELLSSRSSHNTLYSRKSLSPSISLLSIYNFFDDLLSSFASQMLSVSPPSFSSSQQYLVYEIHLSLVQSLDLDLQLIFHHLLLLIIVDYSFHNLLLCFCVDSPYGNSTMKPLYIQRSLQLVNSLSFATPLSYDKSLSFPSHLPTFSKTCNPLINTRKYSSLCFPLLERHNLYPLLVTGLGGSGTHFITKELQTLGFNVAHEDIDRDGSIVGCLSFVISVSLSSSNSVGFTV
jgi:hypothetical protein